MELDDESRNLLIDLYRVYLADNDVLRYDDWSTKNCHSLDRIDRIVEELKEAGIVESRYLGRNVELTWAGVKWFERSDLIEPEIASSENRLRNRIVLAFGNKRDEDGPRHFLDAETLSRDLDVSLDALGRAFGYLVHSGIIEREVANLFRLTSSGVDEYRRFKVHIELAERFEALQESKAPQKRGHDLEVLIADVAKREGWTAPTNVTAAGEENDILLMKPEDFAAFVVSCKWEKDPAKTDYLFSLRERVRLRPGSYGLLISMSGFAKPLVQNAGEAGQGMVLLFGPKDVESIFNGKTTFTQLLQDKWSEMVKHRRASWN